MRASDALQRHDFDPIAFIFGLLFTGSGILVMIGRFDIFNHARWLWPGLLVLLGIAVLVGALGGSAAAAGPVPEVPDLDAIEPPVGPEAFRLPGWPPRGSPQPRATGSDTDVPEPVEPSDQDKEDTEVIGGVDPEAETQVLRERRPPEPPASG